MSQAKNKAPAKASEIVDLSELTSLMKRLRSADGCPWDREQTLSTLTPYIIEEAYEVVAAIESASPAAIKDELGDLLFQVIFVSELSKEAGDFEVQDVIRSCVEKMTRRHPHVFADAKADTSADVLRHWANIKELEAKADSFGSKAEAKGILSGIPTALPALLRAHKISAKAAKSGFDWSDVNEVMEKVSEELAEFKDALEKNDSSAMEEELGDILFSLVNLGRFVEINPEEALRKTIGKFLVRFNHIEKTITKSGRELNSASIKEMNELWTEAKKKEK